MRRIYHDIRQENPIIMTNILAKKDCMIVISREKKLDNDYFYIHSYPFNYIYLYLRN